MRRNYSQSTCAVSPKSSTESLIYCPKLQYQSPSYIYIFSQNSDILLLHRPKLYQNNNPWISRFSKPHLHSLSLVYEELQQLGFVLLFCRYSKQRMDCYTHDPPHVSIKRVPRVPIRYSTLFLTFLHRYKGQLYMIYHHLLLSRLRVSDWSKVS